MSASLELSTPGLTARTAVEGTSFRVVFDGTAESEATELAAFLKVLHASAIEAKASTLVLDMRSLEFMSSACLKAFVMWINLLKDASDRYAVRFVADAQKHWQGRTLTALSHFAADLVTIEQ